VDVRDYAEWVGGNSSPYGYEFCPRKGRIPNAHWFEWYRVMERRKGVPWFKSNDRFWKTPPRRVSRRIKNIYIYCFKGARTSNVMLALQMTVSSTFTITSVRGMSGRAIFRCRLKRNIDRIMVRRTLRDFMNRSLSSPQ